MYLYDIESYKNFFCVAIRNYITKENLFFEISERRNDLQEIKSFFTNLDTFLVSFNGVHYDDMIIKYIITNDFYDDYLDITQDIKRLSDKLINDEFYDDEIKELKYLKVKWTSIDLLLYWSKGLRKTKQLSLKALGTQLGYTTIQELPFKPDSILKLEDLDVLKEYNAMHDIGVLELLLENMKEDIKLREYIKSEYGLTCWSMDAPKIASEYLLEYYCDNTYFDLTVPYWQYKREIRNKKYIPSDWRIGDYLPQVNFKTKFFKDIYDKICNSTKSKPYSKEILFQQKSEHNLILSISQGGIHSDNNNQIYEEDNDYYIVDADIASLYPTLFKNHRFLREELHIILDKYIEIINDRIEAKRNKNKKKDTFLKLLLNSFSGLVDSPVTWLYSPEHILALRIFGQLIQLRFIEELDLNEITILFTNTDGTLVKCHKSKIEIYHKVANDISKEFNIIWEFALLKGIYFVNTNTYLSNIYQEYMLNEELNKVNISEYQKVKKKGATFRYGKDIPLGDSVNEQVIPKALEQYLLNKVPIEEFISNPEKYNLHIYDYCRSDKINKQYEVFWNNNIQQQLNRYYFSKNAPYLFKRKKNKSTMEHVNVGQGVILFNNYEKKEWSKYNINYTYYINKARKIITELKSGYQTKLF